MARDNRQQHGSPKAPEKKFGPYPGGVSVDVWVNDAETNDGSRQFRSITISPRRYRDAQSGEWRDAPSFRPGDLPALIFGLQKALEHCYVVPLAQNGNVSTDDDSF